MSRSEPTRCTAHGLVAGPDGRCVICRREAAAPPERGHRGGLVVLLLLAAAVGGGVWYLAREKARAPEAAVRMDAASPRAAPARRPALARGPRIDAPRPPRPVPPRPPPPTPPPAPPPPAPTAVAEEDPLAARKRMDRMYEEALARQAAERVSITLYMADW